MIDSESFEGKVIFSYDSDTIHQNQHAIFIIYYLIGQYQILINLMQEIDDLFQAMENADGENDEDDDEDDQEEDD